MKAEKILKIVRREICAIGESWRMDWSDFDGRTLHDQLYEISDFIDTAIKSEIDVDFTEGTEKLAAMEKNEYDKANGRTRNQKK